MEQTNNQQIVGGFIRALLATQTLIRYNGKFMDHAKRLATKETDFMNIVDHPNHRVILKPEEWAITRSVHPLEKYSHTNQVILMRGTDYGILVMFGPEAQYDQKQVGKAIKFVGPIPKLHTTMAFRMAAMRFFKRTQGKALLLGADEAILNWIFSPTFQSDLAEQARLDVAAGLKLGDGYAPRTRAEPSQAVRAAKPVTKTEKHPLDIIACRANGFKGVPYNEQTPEQKAAGQAVLTEKSKREIAEKINAMAPAARTYTEVTNVPGGVVAREVMYHPV